MAAEGLAADPAPVAAAGLVAVAGLAPAAVAAAGLVPTAAPSPVPNLAADPGPVAAAPANQRADPPHQTESLTVAQTGKTMIRCLAWITIFIHSELCI